MKSLNSFNEIGMQGIVAIIALVSAITSALVSGLMQVLAKWIESYFSKRQAEIASEHETSMMKEKNLQEIRMKRLDKYYDERKDTFQQFVRNATLFLNDPDGEEAKDYFDDMMKYRSLALLYGNEKYREKDKEFMSIGSKMDDFSLYDESAKRKLDEIIEVINEILRND